MCYAGKYGSSKGYVGLTFIIILRVYKCYYQILIIKLIKVELPDLPVFWASRQSSHTKIQVQKGMEKKNDWQTLHSSPLFQAMD